MNEPLLAPNIPGRIATRPWTCDELDLLQELRILAVPFKDVGKILRRSSTMCHFMVEAHNLAPLIIAKRGAIIKSIIDREGQ